MRNHRRKIATPPPVPEVEPTAVMRFEVEPGVVRYARDFARTSVQSWNRDELAEDAALIVDELVTATIDVGSAGTVVLHDTGHGVHVEVTADAADFDRADRESLGLRIVEATAASWGVAYTWPHYRVIWSELDEDAAVDLREAVDD